MSVPPSAGTWQPWGRTDPLFRSARRAAERFDRLIARPWRVAALVGCTSVLITVAMSYGGRIPVPLIHDEFSYLLAADTFAHGRATNPTHPLWVHFESFHIIQQPTYASKYPVGQGLMLALGQVLFGYPIVGVWISTALACMATAWMLYGWLPPRWALAGGLVLALHPTVMDWGHSYWGGAVAMIGTALLLGGARRMLVPPLERSAAYALAIGLVILANSRPFEGAAVGVSVAACLLVWLCGPAGPSWTMALRRIAAPLTIVLLVAASLMGYHQFKVTGNPLLMPYLVHEATYAITPPLGWQSRRAPPVYRHQVMQRYWAPGTIAPSADSSESNAPRGQVSGVTPLRQRLRAFAERIMKIAKLYGLNQGLFIPLLVLPWCLRRDPWMRTLTVIAGMSVLITIQSAWLLSHQLAPLMPLLVAIGVGSMRELWQRGRLGRTLVAVTVALTLFAASAQYRWWVNEDVRGQEAWFSERARIIDAARRRGEKLLVVVRYAPTHFVHDEWVYNDADIDASSVVWAREMDVTHNQQLLAYFANRRISLLEADVKPWRLVPYPGLSSPPAK